MEQMCDAGIPSRNIMRSLANRVRGLDDLPYAVEHEEIWYVVIRDDAYEMIYCCCMKLESVGFPFRHMFVVIKYANMKKIPSDYILRRWTIGAKEQIEPNEDNITHEEDDVEYENRRIRDPQYQIMASLNMQVEYTEEVEKLDKNPEIVDWFPKEDW
ncbi:hypothetical protein Cgig2_030658 [Carnegiea gigantea]|uniref:Protein FAR1-RELATED SEQUENCE n=1 Tax=Carnegiea gigantea TaxID=171969 RepID=A0A9Q1QB95_9CARY|nr:hypothetical protein Cgig2_030658 [Carnegiea gigantea]